MSFLIVTHRLVTLVCLTVVLQRRKFKNIIELNYICSCSEHLVMVPEFISTESTLQRYESPWTKAYILGVSVVGDIQYMITYLGDKL